MTWFPEDEAAEAQAAYERQEADYWEHHRPRIGSLCSGYGGLDLGVQAVLGGTVAWHVEFDKHPSAILAHHWPHVPNHGDVKHTDWTTVEPIDVLTAGYPCQPFSHAGLRKGSDDPRHLWPDVARAIGVLRPRLVVLENVRGHVSLGLADVLADLSGLGYDATWGVVRAADAGAPHGRARIFICATDADGPGLEGAQSAARHLVPYGGSDADAAAIGRARLRRARRRGTVPENGGVTAADSTRHGRYERRPEPAGIVRGSDAAVRGGATPPDADDADGWGSDTQRLQVGRDAAASGGESRVEWGAYGPAITRWEAVLGRPAPRPTEPGRNGPRLAPAFVEWLMGLPAGHVTAVPDLSRNAQLKALGNGVVPQQAALALRVLLPILLNGAAA